jgi:HD-GYP domain-containing protein (c-di-GMP phosphodiesterase class II)
VLSRWRTRRRWPIGICQTSCNICQLYGLVWSIIDKEDDQMYQTTKVLSNLVIFLAKILPWKQEMCKIGSRYYLHKK